MEQCLLIPWRENRYYAINGVNQSIRTCESASGEIYLPPKKVEVGPSQDGLTGLKANFGGGQDGLFGP